MGTGKAARWLCGAAAAGWGFAVLLGGCNGGGVTPQPPAGLVGATDGGTVAPPVSDSGQPPPLTPDAAVPPAPDAGAPDAGLVFGGPGPWPVGNVLYGASDGILETPVMAITTDETQNLWVATPQALYLLRPGEARFRRYAAADGLHLQENPATYCDNNFPGPGVCGDTPAARCPITGAANALGITEIEGGSANEVFVGYAGNDEGSADWCDPNRHSGKLDRVRLNADGSLTVDRFDLVSNGHGAIYWHNRTVQRMAYDHVIHKHELYVGSNHGVTLLRPDLFRKPNPGEWFDKVNMEYMGDHLHPRVCDGNRPDAGPCDPTTEANQLMGDWRGMAIAPDGDLWVAGKWTAGKIRWVQDLPTWYGRPGSQAYSVAFGDPYPLPPNGNGFRNEPVFPVETEGDPVHLSSVAVGNDGRVWFGSGPNTSQPQQLPDGGTKPVVEYGLAAWTGRAFQRVDPVADLGLPERHVRDLVALPDGRLVIGLKTAGLLLWNPATGEKTRLAAGTYVADDGIVRLKLDTRVSPPALQVATKRGAAVIRVLP